MQSVATKRPHAATVLMFGWEFPPNISGGLGTACHGLSTAMLAEGARLLFVAPTATGEEEIRIINASRVVVEGIKRVNPEGELPVAGQFVDLRVPSQLKPYTPSESTYGSRLEDWTYVVEADEGELLRGRRYTFRGGYGPGLMEEVSRYAEVAGSIARTYDFDVIHAHDWLTYPAGMAAARVSARPLVVHVHATEYDRAGDGHINPEVFEIEKRGMLAADKVVAVSKWTRDIVVSRYGIPASKVEVVHNGVTAGPQQEKSTLPTIFDRVITFLGRVTVQKGPQYFLQAASKVLSRFPDVHFVMAGSGDLLPSMINLASDLKITSRVHFTGFLKGPAIGQLWSITDVYVMPSVSEPFGITPLEAIRAGVPAIVSKQSGVAEVLDNVIKVDFWDTDALASAMVNILERRSLSETLARRGYREVENISWNKAARKIIAIYDEIIVNHQQSEAQVC
jgi:glycogen(starch) synthase